jgi:uncharacterized linocin/CFP29 family protein
MNRLRRELAPLSDAAWAQIDEEARRTLKGFLAARRLVEFDGPKGWDFAGISTGRCSKVDKASDGVSLGERQVQAMVELSIDFTLSREEMDAVDRGSNSPDLSALIDAAKKVALAEDRLVFEGSGGSGVVGLASGSPHSPVSISDDYGKFPHQVANAVAVLRSGGVEGPYAVALGPRCYTGVVETTEHGGYPVLEHLRLVTGGPVVWAPGVEGSVVVSLRGGDFRLTVGGDLALGYVSHDSDKVTLRFNETVTFSNDSPEAAVPLRYSNA